MHDDPTLRPGLRPVEDEPAEPDQVPRLLAFRSAHPDITVELEGFWRARIPAANGETVVRRYELEQLLDELARLLGDWQA